VVLGILNATPDSFSDGGLHVDPSRAADAAAAMLEAGADGVDIGGESTRPGAARVPEAEQIARVVPVIHAVRARLGEGVLISIDTTWAEVARAALDAGAEVINDVSGGSEDGAILPLAAQRRCGLILMHRLTTPERDSFSHRYGAAGERAAPVYPADAGGVCGVVAGALGEMLARAVAAGVEREAVVLDPGLGFGKSVPDNLALLEGAGEMAAALGRPLLSGVSRKSFVGAWAGLPEGHHPTARIAASAQLGARHVQRGARVLRVHDVPETLAALMAWPDESQRGPLAQP
jgi:dihydropteroate synthase